MSASKAALADEHRLCAAEPRGRAAPAWAGLPVPSVAAGGVHDSRSLWMAECPRSLTIWSERPAASCWGLLPWSASVPRRSGENGEVGVSSSVAPQVGGDTGTEHTEKDEERSTALTQNPPPGGADRQGRGAQQQWVGRAGATCTPFPCAPKALAAEARRSRTLTSQGVPGCLASLRVRPALPFICSTYIAAQRPIRRPALPLPGLAALPERRCPCPWRHQRNAAIGRDGDGLPHRNTADQAN